jgi:hypothetical protein
MDIARANPDCVREDHARELDHRRALEVSRRHHFRTVFIDHLYVGRNLGADPVQQPFDRAVRCIMGIDGALNRGRRRDFQNRRPPRGESDGMLGVKVGRVRGRHDELPVRLADRKQEIPAGERFRQQRLG